MRARTAGMRLVFVTNNASRTPESVAVQLTGLGIEARAADVMNSAQAAAARLATELSVGDRVLVVGGAGLVEEVRAAGFEVVTSADDHPKAVVQGFAPDVGWSQLAEAAFAVQRGAWHVVSNRDLTLPTERGDAPGNGSLVAVVQTATGIEPLSVGKPEPTMFRLAAQRCGGQRPLVVGDRLDTDLAAARAAGFPGLQVLTGVSSARDAVLAVPAERPSFLGRDLRSLHVAHSAPHPGPEGWWRCGGAAARVVDGRLELHPAGGGGVDGDGAGGGVAGDRSGGGGVDGDGVDGDGLDLARAACAAVWSAADAGTVVDPGSVPDLA